MIKLTENSQPKNLFVDPVAQTLTVDVENSSKPNTALEEFVAANSDSEESREKLINALDGYKENFSLTDNPLLTAAESYSNSIDRDKRRSAEQSASFIALNDIFQNIGGAISTLGGVTPPKVDKSAFNSAMERVNLLDKADSNRHDAVLKSALNIAENYNRDANMVEESYTDAMTRVYNSDIARENSREDYLYNMANMDSRERMNSDKLLQQREDNELKKLSNIVKKATGGQTQKYDRYVYNSNGERVGLTKENVTKLHQVAKLHEIDGGYNSAPNMQKAQHEYDIMIQEAYLIHENK